MCRVAAAGLIIAVAVLIWQQFTVSFTLFGEPSRVTPAQSVGWFWGYLVLGVAAGVMAIVGLLSRAWVSLVILVVLGVVCVVGVVDTASAARAAMSPAPATTIDGHCACRSGSECTCPGG